MITPDKLSIENLLEARSHVNEPSVEDCAIDPNNVQVKQCVTCPWADTADRLKLSGKEMESLMRMVLTEANVRCHHAAFLGKSEQKICRGARNFQLQIFHSLGVLESPTDRCWAETLTAIRRPGN